jgi:hypothetical protein
MHASTWGSVAASFPDGPGLLIHRLQGSELARADSVNLELSTPAGASLVRFEDVPFDGDTGEVIVAPGTPSSMPTGSSAL